MKNRLLYILLLNIIIPQVTFAQHSKNIADKFLYLLNNYQNDSFKYLISDSFKIKRNFTSYITDKKMFYENYLPILKPIQAKFIIIKDLSNDSNFKYIVEDQSYLLTYLKIKIPKYEIKIMVQGDVVTEMQVDSITGYHEYYSQINTEMNLFFNWLHNKYPKEKEDILIQQEGLYLKRLKEYALEKK